MAVYAIHFVISVNNFLKEGAAEDLEIGGAELRKRPRRPVLEYSMPESINL